MVNNPFYVWDNHNRVYASNPEFKDQTEWFVWDPHSWWEYNEALMQGIEFFPKAEIYRGVRPPDAREFDPTTDKRKKVALLFYEHVAKPWTRGSVADSGPIQDYPNLINDVSLQWADVIITHTTEPMLDWWPMVYGEICRAVHSDRLKSVFAAKNTYTNPPSSRVFSDQLSFFSYVVRGNTYREINEDNTPFRKFMFDALLGTIKTSRMFLFYRLLETDWMDSVLVNLQPRPFDDVRLYIADIDPEGYAKHGLVENFCSPALFELEEPEVQKFKLDTQDKSSRERYSANIIPRPGLPSLPGHNILMSCVVPWNVYQSSWYSIVCETVDIGSTCHFLTDKTSKCLYAKRVFIMCNGAGLLARLRSLGFRTFHGDIIDESYDDEPDDAKRFAMVWEQIQRLHHTDPRQVYTHFREVLEHNHQLICSMPDRVRYNIMQFINQPLL